MFEISCIFSKLYEQNCIELQYKQSFMDVFKHKHTVHVHTALEGKYYLSYSSK